MPQLVSIVLPIWNQADHIDDMIRDYSNSLAGLEPDHELLLVVNGSADSSLRVCERAAKAHPTVRVLSTSTAGWGRAVKIGLSAATGDLLCYTNSARTRGVDLVNVIHYAMRNPGTVVKATRRIRDGLVRRMGSLLFNAECRLLFDVSVWDINATPKVFPRTLSRLLTLASDDDLFDAELVLTCRRAGYPMLEVPIEFTDRRGGLSTTTWRSAARLYLGAVRLHRDRRGSA
jgi:glycosyltransferase involved in cell wall biosynthesis